MQPLIAVDHITYTYPGAGRPALVDISLEFLPGEFVAILGSNGSGKTTLAHHINGLLLPDKGRVLVQGLDTHQQRLLGKIRQIVGVVFQNPEDQIVATTVEEDVAFGPENLGLPTPEIRRRVDEAIAAVGLEAHRLRPPYLLSAGQIQRLALAGALAMRPQCVIFDEATTMLDPSGRRMAHELMNKLLAAGMSVLTVTHDMQEAVAAQRVIILHAGRLVFDGPPRDAFSNADLSSWGLELPPAALLARRLSASIPNLPAQILTLEELFTYLPAYPGRKIPPALTNPILSREEDEPIIEVHTLAHTYLAGTPLAHSALSSVNLSVYRGHSHGLIGVTGSGKSTLLQHLNGLLRPQHGTVRVGPFHLEDANIKTRVITRTAGLVMQNPEMQFFKQYVGDEIAFGLRQWNTPAVRQSTPDLWINDPIAPRVQWAMELVGLDFEQFKDRFTFSLSGGEKRKVALASILVMKPEMLLLDEPTAGLDPISHHDVLNSLHALQQQGITIVVSSHRMDDIAFLAEDLTVFRKGESVMTGPAVNLFEQLDRLNEVGLEPPPAARVAARLRTLNWPLPTGVIRPDQLSNAVDHCMEVLT